MRGPILGAILVVIGVTSSTVCAQEDSRHFSCVVSPYSRAGKPFSPEFLTLVDAFASAGGDTIKVGVPWTTLEPLEGVYDFSDLLFKLDHVILVRGLDAAIQLSLSDMPLWLDDQYKMFGEHGNLLVSTEEDIQLGHRFTRLQAYTPAFSSGLVRLKLVRLQRAMVAALEGRYPQGKLLYGVTTWTPWMESEYPWQEYSDYGGFAIADYRVWLEARFKNIGTLNARWGTDYQSFDDVLVYRLSQEDTGARPDENLRLLDWNAYRHFALKRFSDELSFAAHSGDPGFQFGLQYGALYDFGASRRGTLGVAQIAARAEWITIDDSMDRRYHRGEYSADLLRATLPGKKYAYQVPGPNEGTDEAFLENSLQFFAHGGHLVELGNWDVLLATPEFSSPKWTFIPRVVSAAKASATKAALAGEMRVSVREATMWHERWGYVQARLAEHAALTDAGSRVADVVYVNDLEHAVFPEQDDFRESFGSLTAWTPWGGSWQVEDGRLAQKRDWGLCRISPADAYFGQSRLELTLQMGAGATGWAGAQIRTHAPNDMHFNSGYLVRLRPQGLLELVSGATGTVVASAQTGRDPVAAPLRLTITARDERISIRVDDTPMLSWSDPAAAFTSGNIGLATYQATAHFDDIDLHVLSSIADSFEDGGAAGWAITGDAEPQLGALTLHSAEARLEGRRYGNVVVSAQVRLPVSGGFLGLGATSSAGIRFGIRSGRSLCVVLKSSGQVELQDQAGRRLANGKTALPPIGPVSLQLEVSGGTVRIRVANAPVLVWSDTERLAQGGGIGLMSEGDGVQFDDVRVEPIE
ncbi:MAG: beta-galactosidase [Planctomycetota bacterium]